MIPLLNRGGMMKGFVEGTDRQQTTLLPECLDDWVDERNPVRAVDVFVDALELRELGFDGVTPAATGRPGYHPSPMLKLYIYGYLNRVQSSRRLEREAGRNLEVMWLTGRLVPDHKTIADFRKDNGPALKKVCAQFVALCRKMGLLAKASVAIDGSKFKAVIYICPTGEKLAHHFTNEENGLVLHHYWTNACRTCALKAQCTKGPQRRIKRWEDEYVVDAVQARLDRNPDAMRTRRETVEHPFGTLKMRMGATHFLMKTLPKVATEMALHVLAYNLTRVMNIVGIKPLLAAMRA